MAMALRISFGPRGGSGLMLRLNTTAGAATVPSFGSAFAAISFTVGQGSVSIMDVQNCPIERKCDLNGDGRADLMVNVHAALGCGIGGCSHSDARYDLLASGAGYSIGLQNGPISYTGVYLNDDRCIDRLDNGSLTLHDLRMQRRSTDIGRAPGRHADRLEWGSQ